MSDKQLSNELKIGDPLRLLLAWRQFSGEDLIGEQLDKNEKTEGHR